MLGVIGLWYFTGSGRSARVAEELSARMPGPCEQVDVTPRWVRESLAGRPVPADGLAVVFPIYAGQAPPPLLETVQAVEGRGIPTVPIATWGNVHTGRALRQAQEALLAAGFNVTGGCELVTEHSNNPTLGAGRPTSDEWTQLATYVQQCMERPEASRPFPVEQPDPAHPSLGAVLGLPPGTYAPRVTSVMRHDDDLCNHCEICQIECPTGAIGADWDLNDELCLRCLRCVTSCSEGAWSKVGTEPRAAAWMATHKVPKPSAFH